MCTRLKDCLWFLEVITACLFEDKEEWQVHQALRISSEISMFPKIGSFICEPIWIYFLRRNSVVLTQSVRISERPCFFSSFSLLPLLSLLETEPHYVAQAGLNFSEILFPHLHLLSAGIIGISYHAIFLPSFSVLGTRQANSLLLSCTSSSASHFYLEYGTFGAWAVCLLTL